MEISWVLPEKHNQIAVVGRFFRVATAYHEPLCVKG
jgi:hypothetical protein